MFALYEIGAQKYGKNKKSNFVKKKKRMHNLCSHQLQKQICHTYGTGDEVRAIN